MIPKKNLFSGALGKLHNIGGSKCFTIPHTVDVPVQYQVNTNLIGDFVTCSLDGRLWCLKNSNRYSFFALKWNNSAQKLEFAASVTRINENILARGLDWILTAKVLVKVLDDSPYIATFNLFSDSSILTLQEGQNIGHCYSILPKIQQFKVFDDSLTFLSQFDDINHFRNYLTQFKDIDDFFEAIRQFDDYKVSLEFFQKFNSIKDVLTFVNNTEDIDTLLNSFKTNENIDIFSTLISEFQIIENFLVRRDNNGNMLSRLVPVEFFQTRTVLNNSIFDNDLSFSCSDYHIIAHKGRLWGAGKYALGKVFLLPAIFDNTGKATTFYLYFQHEHKLPRLPQFLRILIDGLTITTFEGHSFAIIGDYVSWEDAKNGCIARGGHLATATSKEKNDFLVSLANSTLGESYAVWLGGKREYSQNNWKWITGEEWSYENWCNGIDYSYEYSNPSGYGIFLEHFYDIINGWAFEDAHLNVNGLSIKYSDMRNRYICEWDSLDVYDTWLNHMNDEQDSYSLAPAFLGDNLRGYKFNSGRNLCSKSDDNTLFNPALAQWINLSEHNGNIHFDINHSKAILLDDKGAYLPGDNNVRFDCNTLNQWLAPANSIDALDDNLIAASDDNFTLVTHPDSNFMREALHNKVLPLSSPIGNGYLFSLGHSTNSNNRNIIDVNQIASSAAVTQPVLWNNIYRHALDIELVNIVRNVSLGSWGCIPAYDKLDFWSFGGEGFRYMTTPFFCGQRILFKILRKNSNYSFFNSRPVYAYDSYEVDVNTEALADIYYIDPDNGNVCFFDTIRANFSEPDDYEFFNLNNRYYVKKYTYIRYICIVQGKLGFLCEKYYFNELGDTSCSHIETFFLPIQDIPDNLKIWCIPNRIGVHYSSGKQGVVLDSVVNSYARFHENSTSLPFALFCPNVPDINKQVASFACYEPYSNLDDNKKKFLHSIHIAGVIKNEENWVYFNPDNGAIVYPTPYEEYQYNFFVEAIYDLYIFRSRLHNDVFNFDSELKRSVLS